MSSSLLFLFNYWIQNIGSKMNESLYSDYFLIEGREGKGGCSLLGNVK